MIRWCLPLLVGAGIVTAYGAPAQEMMAYPARGQSPDQQRQDRYECHSWAVSQSGYDPANPQASAGQSVPPAVARQGGVVSGGMRGAAVGAVGGAIGGNAGKGAAIGAAAGGLVGGMRRRDQEAAMNQQYAQASADQQSAYQRAMAACLQGRGYTVN